MNYRLYILRLFFRIFIIVLLIFGFYYCLTNSYNNYATLIAIGFIYILLNTYAFIKKRFQVIDDFFEAVKYRDFSRWFPEDRGAKDIQFLFRGFNEINRTIKEINSQNQAQNLYLQKILERVDIGIIAFNIDTGDVLWSNESFCKVLDLPSFKNTKFVETRKPNLFNLIFETYHREPSSISIDLKNESIKVLISDTIFTIKEEAFKLIVIQNIDDTLNKNESESWKKLLSVMTHEIMNSIAPISSLADTLQKNVAHYINHPKESIELSDLNSGIHTIKTRSEGLLQFAKTYRSLNKVNHLNLKRVRVKELLENIELLMAPSINTKGINIQFEVEKSKLELDIDTHLIEQVLINLILNAKDACINQPKPNIRVVASENKDRNIVIKVYDNGIGIPPNIMENIFIPFFTSKATGSGIGLSLCKQIMLLHKGRILVKSIEGEGTVFSLIF